jgi:hypothetical protein
MQQHFFNLYFLEVHYQNLQLHQVDSVHFLYPFIFSSLTLIIDPPLPFFGETFLRT